MQVESKRCIRCKKLQPETLFSESSGLCVYCKAEDVDALPKPAVPETTKAELEPQTDTPIAGTGSEWLSWETEETLHFNPENPYFNIANEKSHMRWLS